MEADRKELADALNDKYAFCIIASRLSKNDLIEILCTVMKINRGQMQQIRQNNNQQHKAHD